MTKLVTMAATILLLGVSFVRAESDDLVTGMKDKAVRGAVNAVTGIVEVPMQVYKGYNNGLSLIKNDVGSKAVGTILGFFRGLGHAGGRTSWGFLELFGFWTANAADNEGVGIPLDAEYAWEYGDQYSIFKPSLAEGTKPYVRKLVRGVTDGFTGIAELPGQTLCGISEGNVAGGLVRGVWYWWSREVYGFGSILTCLVPNPADNPGVAFSGEWPWSALTAGIDVE